ncbi:hypothetical protein R1flu_016685 [Riccia fluitans]|uniref:Uncharacterized protein n=1 Tax=Riccia fluitans TaxID=41844 RepID=A0ABD1YMJ6_9MARC
MKPQLVLMRILRRPTTPSRARTPSPSPREPVHHTGTAQWDSNRPFHLAVLESQGILQTYMLETANGGSHADLYPCVAFQLHLFFTDGNVINHESGSNKCHTTSRREWNEVFEDGLKPIKQPWGSFEFIPKRPGEIIFFQAESSRILFAQLPGGSPRSAIYSSSDESDERKFQEKIDRSRSKVFCVGRHSSTIFSIAVRPDGLALVSAGRDGCLRIWRLSDGTMIAQTMFARWREPRNPGIGRVSPLKRQNDEVDCAYPAIRVVSFFGKSWNVAMGCPSGEARTWTQEVDEGSSQLTIKTISDSETFFSGKYPISSIALHVPDSNFPRQRDDDDDGDDEECEEEDDLQERVAVGTNNGKLQVWTRRKNVHEWRTTWSTSPSSEGASIVCLSFRADGGLLAAAASFLAKQLTYEEAESLLLSSPPKKIKHLCERIYLYETSSWACVWTLNFNHQVGTCLFYRPHFRAEDKRNPRTFKSREKVSSCRVLLVASATGPEAHILPEFGTFEFRRKGQNRSEQEKQQSLSSRREAKTVRWADLKRDRGRGRHSSSSSSPVTDRHVKSAPAAWDTSCDHHCDREHIRAVTAEYLVSLRTRSGRSEGTRNASAKSQSRTRSPACGHGCGHAPRKLRIPVRDPYQDPSLLSLPPDCVGLPVDVMMKNRAGTRQGAPQGKTLNCVCCSKRARSKELPVPYSMGQVVVQNLKKVAASKQRPSEASAARPPPRERRAATPPKTRKSSTSSLRAAASLPNSKPIRSSPVTPRFRRKPRTILSKKFDDPIFEDDEALDREHESVSNTRPQFHHQEFPPFFHRHLHPEVPRGPDGQASSRESMGPADEADMLAKDEEEEEIIRAEDEQEDAGSEKEEVENEGISLTCEEPTEKEFGYHHCHQQPVTGANKLQSVTVSDNFHGGKQNLNDQDMSSRSSPKVEQQQDDAAPQYFTTGDGSTVFRQHYTAGDCPQVSVGGKNLPDTPVVGGNELEDFLVEERNPLKFVAVRKKATEQNLVQPEPFSTAKLMARLQEIEQETFSVEAALRVAKLRGIELDEEEENDLRKALEEESKLQLTANKHTIPRLKSRKNSVRYTQLTKISDARVSHSGPMLAARKVRKQVDPKWEDMRTMKPALSDLWDVRERYAEVCSPAPADIDDTVFYRALDREDEDGKIYAHGEATCRHAWSSQALYDSCLY